MLRGLLHSVLCIAALLLSLTSANAAPCHRTERKVECEGVARVSHLSSSGVNLWLMVSNSTPHRLVISRGELEIAIDGEHVATITLRDKVRIARKSHSEVLLPLRFRSHCAVPVWHILRQVVGDSERNITITYEVRGGTGCIRRTFSGENVDVCEFFDTFAINRELISTLGAELK